jgi:hypothetical protein
MPAEAFGYAGKGETPRAQSGAKLTKLATAFDAWRTALRVFFVSFVILLHQRKKYAWAGSQSRPTHRAIGRLRVADASE